MNIRLAGEISESTVDGPGIRYTVFTQGCTHNCVGCHNLHTHPIDKGYLKENKNIIEEMKKNPLISGLTLSGGEPFLQPKEIYNLCILAKEEGYNIIAYSGYTYEELIDKNDEFINSTLEVIDVLIDGKFDILKKSLSLLYRGSSNQRVIDMVKTRINKKVIIKDFSIY